MRRGGPPKKITLVKR
jgi:hypothetical protein